MPDLNYTHPPVVEEMIKVVDFWLDKGVDGFRLDAIKYLVEDGTMLENTPATFSLLEDFNRVYKAHDSTVFTIGEVWSNTASIIPYVQNDRLDVCFEFDLAGNIMGAVNSENPSGVHQHMQTIQASYPALQYGTFLTNHDIDRVFNILNSSTAKMKLAASIYLTLPGIPFVYYGEELGMKGTGAHENIRRPMQWSDAAHGGFTTANPWNNVGANYTTNNVANMESDPNSLLSHYQQLIHIRNEQVALRRGNYLPIESSENKVLSFARIHENEAVVVLANLGPQPPNPALTLPASSLSPGTYFITDLFNDQEMGSVSINEQGGFENWQSPSTPLSPKSTSILLFSKVNPVSIKDDLQATLDFRLSPNPTKDQLHITIEGKSFSNGRVNIFSASGKQVYQGEMQGHSLTLHTTYWTQGVYLVQLSMNGRVGIQKMVIL